jgi:hypothetical protein
LSPLAQPCRDRLIVPRRSMRTTSFPVLVSALAMLAAASGCGGSQPRARHRAAGANADESAASEASEPDTAGCHDETCFVCGGAMCLKGFYCDQSLGGGPACSWLPECAKDASCSCLKSVFGSECSCEERDNGIFLRCQ